jgi:hypothetical protein
LIGLITLAILVFVNSNSTYNINLCKYSEWDRNKNRKFKLLDRDISCRIKISVSNLIFFLFLVQFKFKPLIENNFREYLFFSILSIIVNPINTNNTSWSYDNPIKIAGTIRQGLT